MSDLRDYLRSNLFDGSEDGKVTVPVADLLTDIVEVVGTFLKDVVPIVEPGE